MKLYAKYTISISFPSSKSIPEVNLIKINVSVNINVDTRVGNTMVSCAIWKELEQESFLKTTKIAQVLHEVFEKLIMNACFFQIAQTMLLPIKVEVHPQSKFKLNALVINK